MTSTEMKSVFYNVCKIPKMSHIKKEVLVFARFETLCVYICLANFVAIGQLIICEIDVLRLFAGSCYIHLS